MSKKIFSLSIILICGILLGGTMAAFWHIDRTRLKENYDDFNYGIESQDLTVSQINWQEYSSFRRVSFVLDGDFVINVPADCTCLISDMEDNSELKEVNREKFYLSDGDDLLAYDQVHYQLNNVKVRSEGILRGEEGIHDAVSGYRLVVIFGENEEALGYLPPLDDCFAEWSKEENYFSGNNYEMYLNNFKLSRTYDTDYNMDTDRSAEDIKLIKQEGSVLDCIIDNTDGSGDWEYSAQLPTIELWYQGAWIEMNSPFDSNLAVAVCGQGESKEISVPDDTIKQYSYFLPGIYRLVLWGTDGGYIKSDSFVIDKDI